LLISGSDRFKASESDSGNCEFNDYLSECVVQAVTVAMLTTVLKTTASPRLGEAARWWSSEPFFASQKS
jgi:hypothetical protein